jgi:hypothetical protein
LIKRLNSSRDYQLIPSILANSKFLSECAFTNTCLNKEQRRSFGGGSSSVDFDEDVIDDETFLSLECRVICANASTFLFQFFQQIIS